MADEVIGHMRERIIVPETVEHTSQAFVPAPCRSNRQRGASFPGSPNSGKATGHM